MTTHDRSGYGHDEELIRRVLEAEAATVEVRPDALATIRRRVALRRTRWIPVTWTTAGVAVATVAAAAVGLATCGPPAGPSREPAATGNALPAPGPSRTGPPATSAPPSAPASSAGTASAGPARVSLPVYYLLWDRAEPRLVREFHRLALGADTPELRADVALTHMLAGSPADPDYASGWPAGARVRATSVEGGVVTVDLSGVVTGADDLPQAERAVQQLVWTATAASGAGGVRLRLDGRPVDALWNVDVSGVLRRGPAVDVLAPVWLISPQQGDHVGRTFEVHVAGIVFEATVQLRIRQGERVVDERTLTMSAGPPAQGESKVTVTLPAGTYVVEAYEISARDGSEQHLDGHTVTVG